MKMIFVVFVVERDGKYQAIPDTIRTGENLVYHCTRYNAKTCHLCESRREAEQTAIAWNQQFTFNGTNLI